ncbi:MAG: oligosaccharide flippase family protein [Myxococcales bacterium]|nr:oligosaccharide flippase family protein [Myxococcales bacterium]
MLLSIPPMNASQKNKSIAQVAGRGVIYITFAKIWFMITGWALVFGLPRIFEWSAGGDAEMGQRYYGLYGLTMAGVSILNNGLITGSLQSVSRFTAMDEARAGAVRRTAMLLIGSIGLLLALLYAVFAGLIAEKGLKSTEPELALYMRISAIVVFAYALYAVFIGSFNGRRQFGRQALFDVIFATLKTSSMVVLVFWGFQVLGTVLGFALSAVLIMLAAGWASRIPAREFYPAGPFFRYAVMLLIYTFVFNLLMQFDIFLLSGLVPRMAESAGLTPDAASAIMEARAGQYKAVQQLAFIPFQGTIAIGLVVFPLISKVSQESDKAKARALVSDAVRFTAIFIVGFAVVLAAVPQQAVTLIFKSEYAVGAPALRVLVLGLAAFGLMSIGNNILNAAGLKWRALAVVLIGFLALLVGIYFSITRAGHGDEVLLATAVGTALGMLVALVVSGWFVYRRFGAFCPPLTLLRVLVAAAVAMLVGHFLPDKGKLFTLLECVAVFAVYAAVLLVLREFNASDWARLRQIAPKRNAPQ